MLHPSLQEIYPQKNLIGVNELLADKVNDCNFVSLSSSSDAIIDVSYFGPEKDLNFLLQKHPTRPYTINHGAFIFHNAHITAGTLVVEKNNQILVGHQTLPSYATHLITKRYCRPSSKLFDPSFGRSGMIKRNIIKFDHPIILVTHSNIVYGHFLLEMLGRMYIASQLLNSGVKAKIIYPTKNAPKWFFSLLSLCFSVEQLCAFDDEKEAVHSERVIVPVMLMQEYLFSNIYNNAVSWFSACAASNVNKIRKTNINLPDSKNKRKVFLSRESHVGKQGILNEKEVIKALIQKGFDIFEPQKYSMEEQIEIFKNTHLLISDYNSSLHNSIFMPEESYVLMLNYLSHYQTGLCAVRRQNLGLFSPKDGKYRPANLRGTPDAFYEVDVDDLLRYLDLMEMSF